MICHDLEWKKTLGFMRPPDRFLFFHKKYGRAQAWALEKKARPKRRASGDGGDAGGPGLRGVLRSQIQFGGAMKFYSATGGRNQSRGASMEVFISWSGTRSHYVAKCPYEWLRKVIQTVKPFWSR